MIDEQRNRLFTIVWNSIFQNGKFNQTYAGIKSTSISKASMNDNVIYASERRTISIESMSAHTAFAEIVFQ